MKKLLSICCIIAFALFANAEINCNFLTYGGEVPVLRAGMVANLSSLPPSASLPAPLFVRPLVSEVSDVVTVSTTNFTYSLVYSNGTEVVTNTVDVDYSPFPPDMDYLVYTTNRVITTTVTTNTYVAEIAAYTNALEVGSFLAPGDRLINTAGDSFTGANLIFIEN